MPSLHIVYASTSGHTEYVVEQLASFVREHLPSLVVELQRAELTSADDLLRGDVLLLASGTWNTGGVEGQLNPHMHELLLVRAKDVSLQEKPVALVALGDQRYYYTARSTEHLLRFQKEHQGKSLLPPFVLVNEPHGQEAAIRAWGEKLVAALSVLKK